MINSSNVLYHSAAVVLVAALTQLQALNTFAAPAGPDPQVPAGGGPPGPFPNTSVSAVNVLAKGSTTFNGNVEITGYEGSGPVPWTVTKYNRGDIAMRISPANPTAADANTLNKGFIDFTSANDAALAENQSWRPHPALGVAIPTARQNGPINWGDGEGNFYPTVAIAGASSGYGYSMTDGSFGTGQLDVNLGRAGSHPSSPEGNFSFSVAWFPYDAGWIAGNMGNPDAFSGESRWNDAGQHAAGLASGLMKWQEYPAGTFTYGGLGLLQLPGVNAMTQGMLFTTSSDGSSDVNIIGVAPTNDPGGSSGWIVTIREDSALTGEGVASSGQYQFEFVYVPYTSQNLIGGHIDGTTGAKLHSAGTFTMARTGTGTYEVTIPGKNAASGTLLLQVADFEPGTSVPMASRAFLSYQYDSGSGKFVVQSRKATSDTVSDLSDANFYLAWVDFANPLSPPPGPRLRARDPVAVTDVLVAAKEGNLAVNTDEPEVLITTIDTFNSGAYTDPISGLPAVEALIGYFYDPRTLTPIRGPFFIMGNPSGQITRHDVKYNPVSKEYNVVGNARFLDGVADLLMIARVKTDSAAGAGQPLAGVFAYDGLTNTLSYDDVALAVSSKNGNFVVAAEHKVNGEGEGTYGALFGPNGAVLTPSPSRLDLLQGAGDEDDPDIIYLPRQDVFLYICNTDLAGGPLTNRVVGSVVQTTPSGNQLQVSGPEKLLAQDSGPAQGHPAALENPWNGEIITAFDVGGNDVPNGQLSFYNIGPAPGYTFSSARPQVSYLSGTGGNPYRHQHPMLDADPTSGVILVGHQARSSSIGYPNGYVFSLWDMNGGAMPSQLGQPYYLADVAGAIDTGANYHNVKYSPASDSFVAVFTVSPSLGGSRVTYVASVGVTSYHLPPPELSVELSGGNIILRWPASADGFVLESKPSIDTSTWTAVPDSPVVDGDSLKVTLPASGSNFYRLRL